MSKISEFLRTFSPRKDPAQVGVKLGGWLLPFSLALGLLARRCQRAMWAASQQRPRRRVAADGAKTRGDNERRKEKKEATSLQGRLPEPASQQRPRRREEITRGDNERRKVKKEATSLQGRLQIVCPRGQRGRRFLCQCAVMLPGLDSRDLDIYKYWIRDVKIGKSIVPCRTVPYKRYDSLVVHIPWYGPSKGVACPTGRIVAGPLLIAC